MGEERKWRPGRVEGWERSQEAGTGGMDGAEGRREIREREPA